MLRCCSQTTSNTRVAVKNNGPAEATSATIETQLASAATSIASTTCTFNSTTHKATCPFGAIANGATSYQQFTAYFPILTIGLPLNATATAQPATRKTPAPANDSSSANCTTVTGLIIICRPTPYNRTPSSTRKEYL